LLDDLTDKTLLDAGSGTGWFSKEAVRRGAKVISLDIGPRLLVKVREKCKVRAVAGSVLRLPFPDDTFDYLISSEVIEHTPSPEQALREFGRVLKHEGRIVVTTPNKIWKFAILIANIFKLRPYEGLENWISWGDLRKSCSEAGILIEQEQGIHMFPFILPVMYPILNQLDRFRFRARSIMLNIAILGIKKS
jgi:2-polyprenyl-3-methyl-5-hydroxy-6-metoxy-1,4-benzoquinol methylase